MLVHICCSVDSHFFLERLQREFPEEKLLGFFYDPNIHPYSEYKLRLLDVKRSCKKLGIELIEGDYDVEEWMKAVHGLENEPEKGARCEVCFDKRFEVSGHKALELGEKKFTTTLLVSPLKSQDQLKVSGEKFTQEHNIEFVFLDYRSQGGTQVQSSVSKEEQLYRQNYCGCLYGLNMQRDSTQKLADELMMPLDGRVLPGSVDERLNFYEHRIELEDIGQKYKIVKQKFLNYRQLSGRLFFGKNIVPSFFLHYSTIHNEKAQGRVDFSHNGVHYLNRNEVRLIDLSTFNELANSSFKSVKELIFSPLNIEKELQIRSKLTQNSYDLSAMVVIDRLLDGKITVELKSRQYEDTKENLITLD